MDKRKIFIIVIFTISWTLLAGKTQAMFLQDADDAALMQGGVEDLNLLESWLIAPTEYDNRIHTAKDIFPIATYGVMRKDPTHPEGLTAANLPTSKLWPGSDWREGLLTDASVSDYQSAYSTAYGYDSDFGYYNSAGYTYNFGSLYFYDYLYPLSYWSAPVVRNYHHVHESVLPDDVAGDPLLAVPEPATLVLLGLGTPIFLRRKNRG